MHCARPDLRVECGAGGGVWAGRLRRDGRDFVGDVSNRPPLLELGGCQNGAGLGRSDRGQRRLPLRKFP